MATWVKVCGVTSVEQARVVQGAGVDAVGLNRVPSSPRCIPVALAAEIAAALTCEVILLVADLPEELLAEEVQSIQPDRVQLHGGEPPSYGAWLGTPLLKAHRARPGVLDDIQRYGRRRFLLDAYVRGQLGGTGKRVDLELAREASKLGECVLAGGLNPDNVAAAIEATGCWGVDTASGVESAPGVKDPALVRAFVQAARSVSTTG